MLRRLTAHLTFAIVLCAGASGQTAGKPSKAEPDFSKEPYVVEQSDFSWDFDNDGSARREHVARVRIQSDAALQPFGVLSFSYQKAMETVEVEYVRVRKPSGAVVDSPLDDVEDMPANITREAPFYSDLREKHVPVKGLGVGDVVEYRCHWNQSKSLAPGQFWMAFLLAKDEIVLKQTVKVSVPRDRAVKVKGPMPPAISEDPTRRTYTWTTSNLEKSHRLKADLALLGAKGTFPAPDILVSSFRTWEEVAQWYVGLQRDRVAASPEIRSKAAELTAHAATEDDKLKAIYNYVSSEFRYIGVAFGIGRYQPHYAAEILANQYGDCKDKHTLLASLLSVAGIPAYPALVNSSRTIDVEVPSPAQFDHVITAVPRGKEILWLDSTTEVAPAGYLVPPLRGKDALVLYDSAAFKKTVIDPPDATLWRFRMESRLDDKGTLTGKVEESLTGDLGVQFRAAFRKLPRDQWKDLVQRISYATGFAGKVSDVNVDRLDPTSPVHFSYTYQREDFPDWQNHRIVVPAPTALTLPAEEDGKLPSSFWLSAPGEFVFDSIVTLPKGYTATRPADKHVTEDFMEYGATYEAKDDTLAGHYRVVIKQREVSGPKVAAYKDFAKKVTDDRDQYVELNSSTLRTGQEAMLSLQKRVWALPDSTDPRALESENEAKEDFQRGLMEQGLRAYKRAVTIDPKFTRAWIVLGQMYMATMQTDAGIAAMRDAVKSAPQEPITYKLLAFALAGSNRRDEAIKVWEDLAKVAPDERDLASNLASLLVLQKRYKDALPYLETAVKRYPDKEEPYGMLAIAYLHLGQDDKALEMFDKVLKLSPGAENLNNVAYTLADEGKHLDVALKFAQQAVHGEEEQSEKVKLSTLSIEDLRHTRSLSAYWDTLGWVYFRAGDFKHAENYLRASWSVRQDPLIGYHLGQVYEAQHRRADAVHIYRLAGSIIGVRGDDAEAVESANKRLRALNAPAVNAGARGSSAGEELSKERTVHLPRAANVSGVAELFVLLAPGPKVEDIKVLSGSQEMRDLSKILLNARFNAVFPENSSGRVVRRGILGCYPHSGCSFALIPTDLVRSVE